MRTAWLAGLALVALGAGPAHGDEWSHRYPVQGRPELHVKTDDGSVRVEAAQGSEIEARVTTVGWGIGPGEVSITESQSGDRVEIEVRRPRVSVPSPADLDVDTGDGSIEVKGLSGSLALETGDGSITAEGLEGEIRRHTGDGSIRAVDLSGELEAHTGDGEMNVRGRFDRLDLHTGDGAIEAVADEGSRVQAAWSLRSGDGSITLRTPEDLGATLDAHTGDGHIDLDRSVTIVGRISKSAVKGTMGSGGSPLTIQTGDGSIHLLGL